MPSSATGTSCPSRDSETNFTDQLDERVLILKAPAVSHAEARAAIESITSDFPDAMVDDRNGYKEDAKSQIDVILALVAVLLGLAVVIAVLGIINTLALSIFERTHELGLLRAVECHESSCGR